MKNKHLGWLRTLAILIPYLLIVGIFQYLGMRIAGVDYTNTTQQQSSEQHLITTFFDLMGTFLILWLFMKFVNKESFMKLGFYSKNRANDFIVGFSIGALIMAGAYFFLWAIDEIHFLKMVVNFKEILFSILLFLMVAIIEEALLRGYILRNLMMSFNKYVALIVSSLLFSLMHGFNPNIDLFSLFGLFIAGILLGISYIYTKNLWFPIALHLSWNLFQSLLGFNVSGQDFYSLIEFNIEHKNLVNGGAFGFEGSYLSILAEIVVIIGIFMYYNKKSTSTVKPFT